MPTITSSDLDRMQTQGRLVATKDNKQAFEAAAEALALTLLEDDARNYTRLWLWFEEGARNYVDGQYHLEGIQRRLKERARELYEENLVPPKPHTHKLHIYGEGRYRCSICGGNTFTYKDFLETQ